MFVIVDPVNPQNNTARNSHRTPDILKKFREAFMHLKNLVQGEYLRLQKLRQLSINASLATLVEESKDTGEAVAVKSGQGEPEKSNDADIKSKKES